MREIKFRIWNKSIYPNLLESTNFSLDNTGWININKSTNGGIDQYTGLKDKNGKEIYEGDILSCTRKIIFEGKIDEIKKVLYCEYTEMFARFSFRCEYEQNSPYSLDDFDSFEVIGNIYENPDLLSY